MNKDNSLKGILQEYYNINASEVLKNEESTDGNVYNINTSKEKYILKIYKDENHTIQMCKIIKRLKEKDFYVPRILVNKDNSYYTKADNNFLMLYTFLEGTEISKKFKIIPNNISIKIAQELKRFHNENKENIGLKEINFTDCNFRKSLLHFDLTKDNIFYNESTDKIGFIDFDDAKYGESIIDVAILIVNLYFSKSRGNNLEGLKIFVDTYYKDNEETKKQEVPFIGEIARKWLNGILKNDNLDTSIIDSIEFKVRALEEYLGNTVI